jgi:sugar diacid utilization regulator
MNTTAEHHRAEEGLQKLLRVIARDACSLVGVQRCSVYLRQGHGELFRGRITYIAGDDPRRPIRQLTAGVEADRFTREIVSTGRPVLVSDARTDPRVVRKAMRDWHVERILGLPMVIGDQVRGIMFLDNSDVPHNYTAEEQRVAGAFANLAAVAVAYAQQAVRLRQGSDRATSQAELLRRVLAASDELARMFAADASFPEIAGAVSDLTSKACWIYADQHRRLTAAGIDDIDPPCTPLDAPARYHDEVRRALGGIAGSEPAIIGPLPNAGLERQFLVAPVADHVRISGHVVLSAAKGGRITPFDKAVARRLGVLLLKRMSAEQRRSELGRLAAESLAFDLISSVADRSSIEHRARVLEVDLDREHFVCAMRSTDALRPNGAQVATAFSAQFSASLVLCCRSGQSVVAIFPSGADGSQPQALDRATECIASVGRQLYGGSPFDAALARASGAPAEYAAAAQSAAALLSVNEALRLRNQPEGSSSAEVIVSARDVDLAVLLASDVSRVIARRLAAEALGPLVLDPAHMTLRSTLSAFLSASCNIRAAAQQLGVHHNTVRYRLTRIYDLTGLRVATRVQDQLTAHLALNILLDRD